MAKTHFPPSLGAEVKPFVSRSDLERGPHAFRSLNIAWRFTFGVRPARGWFT